MQTYTYSYKYAGINRMELRRRWVGGWQRGAVEQGEAGHVAFTSPHSEALTPPAECFESTILVEGNKGHRCSSVICMLKLHWILVDRSSQQNAGVKAALPLN